IGLKKKRKRKSQPTKHEFATDSYEPSYILEARILKPIINKGDKLNKLKYFGFDREDVIELEIFIFGHGKIDTEKSFFNTIFPLGIKEKNQRIDRVKWEEVIGASYLGIIDKDHIRRESLPIRRLDADAGMFFPVPPDAYAKAEVYGKKQEAILRASGMLFTKKEYSPALSIKLEVPKNMPDGDHQVKILYFYNDFNKWYSDESVINFHVNSFYEKHSTLTQIGIGLAIIILVGLMAFIWKVVSLMTLLIIQ
ncbi:MAG: hypothetical protein ACE5J5_04480, partial [Candidatus Hydrothermarchaeales archaeon]